MTTEQTLNYEMWLKALQGFWNIKTMHLCVVLRLNTMKEMVIYLW